MPTPSIKAGPPSSTEITSWAAVTLATIAGVYFIVDSFIAPIRGCTEVPACTEDFDKVAGLTTFNGYAICGLTTALVLEVVSLHFSYESARPVLGLINGLDNTFMPPVLLCISLFVLVLENLVFLSSSTPWLAHAGTGGRPVYTSIYCEWLINVPILLVLAGACALDRPSGQIARPLLVTNIYIVFAWSAHFIPDPFLRWLVVGVTFFMYGWASRDMVRWAASYRDDVDPDVSGSHLRYASAMGLIVIFGAYGIVYLCRLTDTISSYHERVWYLGMNIGSKVLMLMLFGGIRSSRYHDLIVNMLVNTHFSFRRQVAVMDGPDALGNGSGAMYKPLVEDG